LGALRLKELIISRLKASQ